MTLPIALQLYSVRDELAADFYGTLKQIKEMGYDGVELAGLGGRDPLEVRQMLEELGLQIRSAHISLEEMVLDGAFERYKQVGCCYAVVPWMAHGEHCEQLEENIRLIGDLARKARDTGLMIQYHNHEFEFQLVDGKPALDIIYETVPADLLQPQVDTCWVRFAGYDPAAYLRKYAGRISQVHLKDYVCSSENGSILPEYVGKGDCGRAAVDFQFRPVGYGIQNIPEIVRAAVESGAQWLIVEQDLSPDRSPLEAARASVEYLRTL